MIGIDNIKSAYYKVFGTHSDKELKKLRPKVVAINRIEQKLQGLSDEDLKAFTPHFKEKLAQGATVDDILVESFAVIREVGRRTLNMRHYDVQLLGGMVLHNGMVAEMKTGEGKTLVATLPVYLNALEGKGVHVITVNDYLAGRDADWMGTIYNFMGLSVGKVLSNMRDPALKKQGYQADVTYGTNNEFGFDYLRDNMKFNIEDYVQRALHYAIVDEVDSILVDEARTPLIISGPAKSNVDKYMEIDKPIPQLREDIDYIFDEKSRHISLTDAGIDLVEDRLGLENLYEPKNMVSLHHVNQALKAHKLFKVDRDYLIKNGQVMIIDEHTGRPMEGRRWSDGLHQAVEAKERVRVQPESQTYASITYQNYFRMYRKLSGMTGTAETEVEEFRKIYNLDVVVVPTNEPVIREDHDDIIYKTNSEKLKSILSEINEAHAKGQPILVGTVSVEKSALISAHLDRNGIKHEVLNAKNHAREALIVAQAGRLGAVTVSTNMAGRGTDIKLGGDPEGMAKHEIDPDVDPAGYKALFERYHVQCAAEKEDVLAAGGLFILGTERHESRRIDNQLRGRSGRQGDPGRSRFYLCLQDDLLRLFGSDRLIDWMERMGMKDDEPIEHRWVTKQIESAQKKVEGHNFNIRKNLLEYDDVMNLQRTYIYDMRKKALLGENIREMCIEAIDGLVEDISCSCIDASVHPEYWKIDQIRVQMKDIFDVDWEMSDEELRDMSVFDLRTMMRDDAVSKYAEKEGEVGEEEMRKYERMLLLQFTDQFWKDHLLAMDRLRDGIGLRGYGQKNPLLEYKKEGTGMFMLMNSLKDEAVISRIVRLDPEMLVLPDDESDKQEARRLASQTNPDIPDVQLPNVIFLPPPREVFDYLVGQKEAAIAQQKEAEKQAEIEAALSTKRPEKGVEAKEFGLQNGIGRNEPCPCGSGSKFKKCCMKA
ncbi:MAG: preprotein translocase subunit SecA [Myxococcota bacterium]|nr:preprotein translocase subunit SecA [Myxococcota bacterium]